MKQLTKAVTYKAFLTFLMLTFIQTIVWAQDTTRSSSSSSTSVKVTKEGADWYAQPWVWVVGGAVLILLLVALLSGGRSRSTAGRTDKVTVTKTRSTDSDV